jgi:hypothetical protein
MGQELWLTEKQLSQLDFLDAQFSACSGMEQTIASGIFKGRPHGGVSIAWNKSERVRQGKEYKIRKDSNH